MSSRRRIEERIRRKEQDIQELKSKIREGKAYLQALQDVLKLLPRDEAGAVGTVLRHGSAASGAREAILQAGQPLHISALLEALGRENTRSARSSLSGSLAAYVRRNEVFTRPKPNTFGLIEMPQEEEPDPSTEPPETFGSEEDSNLDEIMPF